MVPTADHNTPQCAWSLQIVAGHQGECKKVTLRPFLAGILTLKTVLQSAPGHAIFTQKNEKFSGEGHSPSPSGRRTPPPALTPSVPRPLASIIKS